ncbi:M23 family metallopeptidase [Candidatus Uhrbacteria bacterium]|nr:M23 family metallopeptidase [Candidatus Uhrbacteria bacterium]
MSKKLFVGLLAVLVLVAPQAHAADAFRVIRFPVDGVASFADSFNDGSTRGRVHHGIDIMAPKMTPVVAATDGHVRWLTATEQSYGWMVVLEDDEGYAYHYIHLNNDSPGTDDGRGGRATAIAPEIQWGAPVTKGQVIGWVGDSGNAESTPPHLHFEIHVPSGSAMNPYRSLLAAERQGFFRIADVQSAVTSIDVDKQLAPTPGGAVFCVAGSLIRSTTTTAVYYCGADGKRYVFPNQKVYASWYANFSAVQKMTDLEMAMIPIGGNVTYKPGMRLVKIATDPKVYAVDRGGTLRWVTSSTVAAKLYGVQWAKHVEDIPDTFFVNYRVGESVTAAD